jgi:hypothetical protein
VYDVAAGGVQQPATKGKIQGSSHQCHFTPFDKYVTQLRQPKASHGTNNIQMAMSMATNQHRRFQDTRASTFALETETPMISMKSPIIDIGLSMIWQGNDVDT